MVYRKKFIVRVYNKEKTECKERYCGSIDEICELLGIKKTTYRSFQQKKLKMNTPKTEFLQFVEIIRLKKEDTVKPPPKYQSTYDSDKKLDDIFNKM